MEEKACCVTGHREIPSQQLPYVEQRLRQAVQTAIADGYTRFLSGFANGADLMFAAVVAEAKSQHSELLLEAAIPYAGRLKTKDKQVHTLLQACDNIKIVCELYTPSCFLQRNRYMVAQSQRVIAVYDGRNHGGTWYTMQYARKLGRDVQVIGI